MKTGSAAAAVILFALLSLASATASADAPREPYPIDLRIEGGQCTANPFTTVESLRRIAWDLRGEGAQSTFRLDIARNPLELRHRPDFAIMLQTSETHLSVSQYPELRRLLATTPGRYYYSVFVWDEERHSGNWSDWAACDLSYDHYVQEENSLPRGHIYSNWFVVDPCFTGYTWDLAAGRWTWKMDAHPSFYVWGPGHHHPWGEGSGAGQFVRARGGNLYLAAGNVRAADDQQVGMLLVSDDGGNTWTSKSLPDFSDIPDTPDKFVPTSIAYDGTSGRNLIHIICHADSIGLPYDVWDIVYDIRSDCFGDPVKLNIYDEDPAAQAPSAVVDDQGVLHVVWYSGGGFTGERPKICHAWRPEPTSEPTMEWVRIGDRETHPIAYGLIPSIYAAPGKLHLFFTRVWPGQSNRQASMMHLTKDSGDASRQDWGLLPRPFTYPDSLAGAYDHAVVIEPTALGYRLHFIGLPFEYHVEQGGADELWYNVYNSETGQWEYDPRRPAGSGRPPYPTIFTAEQFEDVVGIEPQSEIGTKLYEYPALTLSSDGTLVAAVRVRMYGKQPEDPESPYETADHWLTERDVIAWLTKAPEDPAWRFSANQVIGDAKGWGIGAYRAMFPMQAQRTEGFVHVAWAGGEHYSIAIGRAEEHVFDDYKNPYAFNVYFEPEPDQHGHCLYNYHPLFHGLFHKKLVFNMGGGGREAGSADEYPSLRMTDPAPNPFSARTTISYEIPQDVDRVLLRVYDVAGRLVRTLVDGPQKGGPHEVVWDGRDGTGHPCASGIYFSTLTVEKGQALRRKMVLLR